VSRFFDVLTVREAAELIGISPATLVRWGDEGRILFSVGPDGQRLFKKDDIEKVAVLPEKTPDEDT
jgi:excisionase family DNA binding protein